MLPTGVMKLSQVCEHVLCAIAVNAKLRSFTIELYYLVVYILFCTPLPTTPIWSSGYTRVKIVFLSS